MEYTKYRLEIVRENSFNSDYEYNIKNSVDVRDFLVNVCKLHRNPSEVVMVIAVNSKGNVIGFTQVSSGSLDSSIVEPRDVFRYAIMSNAAGIIIAHNHPSENVTPSNDDVAVTKRISEAGDILRIKLLDHVIIGNETDYTSLKAMQYF